MKNTMKALGAALVFGSLLTLAAPRQARAVDLNQLQVANLDKVAAGSQVQGNTWPLMTVTYVGTSTEAVLTITTYTITAYAPFNTLDTSFGTGTTGSYGIDTAPYSTLGGLCDAIDALANYVCVLNGGRRGDNSYLLKKQTAASSTATTNLKQSGGYQILSSTSGPGGLNTNVNNMRLGIQALNANARVRLKYLTVNNLGAGNVTIYGKLRKYEGASDGVTRDDNTQVWQKTTANSTELSAPAAYPVAGTWMEFAKGAHVVISAGDSTIAQGTTNFLEAQWDEVGP